MPQPSSNDTTRTAEQIALERAKGEVSDVLVLIEHALDRAKRGQKTVKKDDVDTNAILALGIVVTDLNKLRKRLLQDTYFAGDALRLL